MNSNVSGRMRTPIHALVRDAEEHLSVILTASEHGYYESALEAQRLAKEAIQAIRKELLRPRQGEPHPCRDLDA